MGAIAKWIGIILVVGLLVAAGTWYVRKGADAPAQFRTAKITRGDLVSSISATGTVEPEEVIDVGAQVAGQIISFGTDINGKTVDFGSVIKEGAVIAKIDDAIYAAEVTEAAAQLEQAKAGVAKAEADLVTSHSKLDQAQRDWERAQKLGPSDALAQSTYDNYRAVYEQAKAAISVGNAAVVQAKASVSQSESTLSRAKRNLGYCTIYAPVTGTVIARRVNIGQTVVSSLNAPSLFLLAKDLRRMEVWVAVNEADIGNIHPGQPVSFGVDAFPGATFKGVVDKVRLDASMTQNVVTYTVEATVDNPDLKLLPYLTANVQFEVARADDALLVPNAALRWQPQTEQVSPEVRASMSNANAADSGSTSAPSRGGEASADRPRGGGGGASGGGWRGRGGDGTSRPTSGPATAASNVARPHPAVLWVKDGNFVKPIRVYAGLTDGVQTVVSGEGVTEDLDVVIGEVVATADTGAPQATNPFMPQFPRRGAGGGGGGPGGGGRPGGGGGGPGGGGGGR